ncbi:MAG: MucB/RseB C-terminal domain-containing protein [Gammaproteobacteria bacterium]|nr:MucB/RseB C-terminal domain-containing protein [Gammaproteobacteria bacterium]
MIGLARTLTLTLMLLVGWMAGAAASDPERDAYDWLMSMSEAGRTLSYVGRFVYQYDDEIESVEIVHRAGPDGPQERLRALNGDPREVQRDRDSVRVYQSGDGGVVKRAAAPNFSAELPAHLPRLKSLYSAELGPQDRIAGRPVQVLDIVPRDPHRFGYRFWADRESGLLLRSDLLDGSGRVLERCMFTLIELSPAIDAALFQPADAEVSHQTVAAGPSPPPSPIGADSHWRIEWVPTGFDLMDKVSRRHGDGRLEQWVYSDGLVSVSVFVERAADATTRFQGGSRIGAMNAYGRMVDGYQVTVVGQVPSATLARISHSVESTAVD